MTGEETFETGGVGRPFAWIFGIAYLAVALLELATKGSGLRLGGTTILHFGGIHLGIHLAVAALLLGSALAGEGAARAVARIVGVLLLIVTVWNIVAPDPYAELVGMQGELPVTYTILHAITAIWALFAGFSGDQRMEPA